MQWTQGGLLAFSASLDSVNVAIGYALMAMRALAAAALALFQCVKFELCIALGSVALIFGLL